MYDYPEEPYVDDYDQGCEQPSEEGFMHFTLKDFSELINSNGVSQVLGNLDKDVEHKLYEHYFKQIRRGE